MVSLGHITECPTIQYSGIPKILDLTEYFWVFPLHNYKYGGNAVDMPNCQTLCVVNKDQRYKSLLVFPVVFDMHISAQKDSKFWCQ